MAKKRKGRYKNKKKGANVCSYQQKKEKKKKRLPSQIRSITELWRAIPKQPLPLANQSQQIAAVNISDSADLNKDIMIISLLYSTPSNDSRGLQPEPA